ncbi:ComEA family DNA-binding protein [Paenibacillus sp. EC2-1]|uniref:ComEA family DNA-binding protein n=1 Tax=Paenibacillus sp. EC2-1 TaxID=3388665 RepID=UPI003BEF2814
MRRLPIGFSIIAVCIGCFLILFAGGKKDGIEEWKPLNSEIKEALGMEESTNKVETTNKDKSSEMTSATEKASEEKPSLEAVSHEKNENVKEKEQEEILSNTDTSGKININTADLAALMDLPGIGEKKAQAIIDYRSKNGPFPSVSSLMDVKGIGPKMLEKMKPYVAL